MMLKKLLRNALDSTNLAVRRERINNFLGKAEEYLGLIREKVQQFEEATKNYEQSWKISKGKAPSVG